MSSKRTQNGLMPVALAVLGMIFLGGCTPVAPGQLESFVTALLGSAAAALLL